MNILSAFTAYPLPAGYNAGQAARSPQPAPARTDDSADIRATPRMDFLPARPDDDDLEAQRNRLLPDDAPAAIRDFLTTANNSDERRLGRFVDIQA